MSESIDMYLVTIARIAEAIREETVPLPMLAERLDILPVSTNQMIRKLEETGLVRYLPYKGVQLTEEGCEIAAQVLRHHQIWEVFLKDYLKFPGESVDSLACRLEHVLSNDEIENLAAFMDNSALPLESSFPRSISGCPEWGQEFRLTELSIDQCGAVTRIIADQAVLSFLSADGVFPGVIIAALARGDAGDLLVRVGDQGRLHLSSEVADHIWLRKV
jgi:DtxR family Mn-dependent transcriptional regulator